VNPNPWPRRLVGAGVSAALGGSLIAVFGATPSGWLVAAAGLVSLLMGSRQALAESCASSNGLAAGANPRAQQVAVAADLLLAAAWEAGALVRRVPELPRVAEDVASAVARWRERGLLDRPEAAHLLPPPLEKVHLEPLQVPGIGTAEHLVFASEYEAADPEIAAVYRENVANQSAHALLFRHRSGGPRPTLIAIHGFGMGRLHLDLAWLRLRGLDLAGLHRELGIDVAYLILPFHGPRTAGAVSGTGFFDAHPLVATAALGQAVWDVRRVAGWLRAQGVPALGVQGLSLGGCVAALHASLDASLACAMPMIPAVDLAGVFWGQLPEARRRDWESAGLGREQIAQAWSLHAPLRHRPLAPHAARMIVAGAVDQVAPLADARALWSHWDEPAAHWMPGGHLLWLGGAPLQQRLREHLRGTLLAGSRAALPSLSRFRASPPPTDAS
jgi:dienelactone hydrolase